jgi:hypothetical protein
MRTKPSLAALTLLLIPLGACATVTRGTSTAWAVSSEPAGAQVSTSNGYSCPATPCSIRMPRKDGFTAAVSKPGYRTAQITVAPIPGAGLPLALDVLASAVMLTTADVVDGAASDLSPNPAKVSLLPAP